MLPLTTHKHARGSAECRLQRNQICPSRSELYLPTNDDKTGTSGQGEKLRGLLDQGMESCLVRKANRWEQSQMQLNDALPARHFTEVVRHARLAYAYAGVRVTESAYSNS